MGGDRGERRGKERGGRSRGQMMEELGLCTRCVPGGESLSEEESKVQRGQGEQTYLLHRAILPPRTNLISPLDFLSWDKHHHSQSSPGSEPPSCPPSCPHSCSLQILSVLPPTPPHVRLLLLCVLPGPALLRALSIPCLHQPPDWPSGPEGLPHVDMPKLLLNEDQITARPRRSR